MIWLTLVLHLEGYDFLEHLRSILCLAPVTGLLLVSQPVANACMAGVLPGQSGLFRRQLLKGKGLCEMQRSMSHA